MSLISVETYGQNKDTGIYTHYKSKDNSDFSYYPFFGLSLSINNPTFYSKEFIYNKDNKYINANEKYLLAMNMSYKSLIVDINYFYNGYKSPLTQNDIVYT
jgi:hypothetical protein